MEDGHQGYERVMKDALLVEFERSSSNRAKIEKSQEKERKEKRSKLDDCNGTLPVPPFVPKMQSVIIEDITEWATIKIQEIQQRVR